MSEIWQYVPSVPGLRASSLGRIWCDPIKVATRYGSVRTNVFKPRVGCWHKATGLQGGRFTIRVHNKNYILARLVCEAFNGVPPYARAVCMHLNEDPRDNRACNLVWGTQKENLNAPGFLAYCCARTGDNNPYVKGRKKRSEL